MRQPLRRRRAFTSLELLVATVLGTLVIVGAVLLFLSGVRLSMGMQASSHTLRNGSSSVERMRLSLEEATAVTLPDDSAPHALWPQTALGPTSNYLTAWGGRQVSTAVFASQLGTRTLRLRTDASTLQNLAIPLRSVVNRGVLIYRGNTDGTPNPSSGTFLWQWSYEDGVIVRKTVLYRKLSSRPEAVAFRRGSTSGQVMRYRLLLAEKDSYQRDMTVAGGGSHNDLEASDLAVSLLNHAGESVPATALPTGGGSHP